MTGVHQPFDHLPPHVREATHGFLDESCIIAITDLKGTIVYANDAFIRISGYPREELLGRNHRLLKSGQHPPEFFRDMWRTVARGNIWKGEICNRARDGSIYWVESTISPLRDADGRTTHYCALRIDITARKEAQQRLLDAMEQNAERRHLESVGRMADGILHDLNNLLGGAMMLTDLGASAPQDLDEQRMFLHRMAQLIRNVRDFSTGRAPEMKLCDAARAINEACRLASYVARREREIAIEIDTAAAEGLAIRINEAQLLEVVLNLFTNAVEALAEQPHPRIVVRVAADAEGRALILTVTDNGPGVPAAIASRLFEPFISSKGSGRGVGLAAARRLARGLEGDLSLVPSEGGACFRLTLPIAAGTATPDRTQRAVPPVVAADAGLVLLADDDREFLGMLDAGLREFGYRTISATAADDAIILAEQFRDCLAAAVLDSVGTVRECALVGFLRTVKRELPIVLVSGALIEPGVRETQHGPVHVLPKPFAAADLVSLLRPPAQ
jgi:PAS domain S-box-containing protein